MTITLDVKQAIILLLLIVLIILVIFMTVLIANAIKSIKKANLILDDAKRVSSVAADTTESVEGVVGDISEMVSSVSDTVRGNTSVIDMFRKIGAGAVSVKNVIEKLAAQADKEEPKKAKRGKK